MKNDLKHNAGKNLPAQSSELTGTAFLKQQPQVLNNYLLTFNSDSLQVQMNWGRSNPRGLRKGFTTHSLDVGYPQPFSFFLPSIHSFLRLFLCGWRRRLSNACKKRL